jgi:hypothetical protein
MIIGSPPFHVGQQLWGLLSGRPGAACQRCHAMSDGQIHPLDESGVESSREAQSEAQATLRASPVPRRITGVTRTSLRRRSLFFTWP